MIAKQRCVLPLSVAHSISHVGLRHIGAWSSYKLHRRHCRCTTCCHRWHIDDAGAGTGGATGVGTDGGRGIVAGPCEGASARAGSGGGRGRMCFSLLFL